MVIPRVGYGQLAVKIDLMPEAQVALPRYSGGKGCLDHSQNLVIFLPSPGSGGHDPPGCLMWEMNAAAPDPIGMEVLLPTQMVHSKGSTTSGWRQTWIIGNSTIQLSEMREKLMDNSSSLGPDRISKKALLNWNPDCKRIAMDG